MALAPASPESTPRGDAWITYEWFDEGDDFKSIFVARPDGTEAHVISDPELGEVRGPTWSPDGKRIAFVNRLDAAPDGEIWTMAADGSDAKLLFDPREDCPGGAFWPSYSPDGTRIAMVCYQLDSATIAVVDLASLEITTAYADVFFPEHLDNPPSWSPEGETLAFDLQHWGESDENIDGSRIGTMPASGGEVTWLNDLDSAAAWADWHPTDDLIAYNTYDLGNWHLVEADQPSNVFTMHSDGSTVSQLTHLDNPNSKRVAQARWLPDGSGLIASCSYGNPVAGVQVCLVDPSSGDVSYTDHILAGARPEMQPVSTE